jgi:hypothetical protein
MARRRPILLVLALLVAAEAITREKAKEAKLCRKVTKRKTKYESASEKYERMFDEPCEAVAVEACAAGSYRPSDGDDCVAVETLADQVGQLQVALATALQEKAALQTQVTELTACSDVEGTCDQYPSLQQCVTPLENTCQRCVWWQGRTHPECGDALLDACDGW